MKPYSKYFAETKPIYEFVVRIAGCDFTSEMKSKMASALSMYVVESASTTRRLPIREHAEFVGLGPCEVYMIDIAVRYPVISDQIRQVVAECLSISARQVVVRTKLQEANHEPIAKPKQAKDGSVLNNPELESSSAQNLVGNQRIESMLKELETRRYEIAGLTARQT